MLLDDKTLLISGVGSGLGTAIAAAAIRDGANVVIGARTANYLEQAAGQLDPSGDRVAWKATDIAEPDQCQALADLAVERFGTIDGVVHCAALDTMFGGLDGADLATWQRAFDVNFFGTMQLTQCALPSLKTKGGSIVFIGTQSVHWCQVPQAAYAASKGALLGASAHLAHELGPHRIRVNTVVPTWMWGPSVEFYVKSTAKARGVDIEEVVGEITAGMPLGEIPSVADVAEAVVFFASDRARMITAQSLFVNAGEYTR
jgi:NAD(P)-dependent dehydrogenase (short-subunit alcohol dehydrogenase family)